MLAKIEADSSQHVSFTTYMDVGHEKLDEENVEKAWKRGGWNEKLNSKDIFDASHLADDIILIRDGVCHMTSGVRISVIRQVRCLAA